MKGKSEPREISLSEKITAKATKGIGTPFSLFLHTVFFAGTFSLLWFDWTIEEILLVLTTVVSLEAIYLAIFIQMTVNRQEAQLREVGEDIEEISEDIDEIQEDVVEISKDVDEISEDVEELGKDVEEISEDIEEDEKEDDDAQAELHAKLKKIENALISLIQEIEDTRKKE